MRRTGPARPQHSREQRPDRAVIDIGSNSVRLVVYSGSQRAPRTWLNEKVMARLGRDLSLTGRMPDKAIDLAFAALARHVTILADLGIDDVQTVATAAVREAENGCEFLARVRALGLSPRLLSGEEEAQGSAFGVIGAFPGAQGTVADLGGGSLELIMVEHDDSHDGCSLPLGTLRLPALRERGPEGFRKAIEKEMAKAGWAFAHPGPLYMVGGTWRALAAFAMNAADHPVTDPHAFALTSEQADRIAKEVAKLEPAELASIRGIASSRAAGLPDAAAMLRVMLAELEPEGLVFSSWGLREGLLFQRLDIEARAADPLIAAVAEFAGPRGGLRGMAEQIAAWAGGARADDGDRGGTLRLAATFLSLAASHLEPNLRARHAFEWAIDKRWVGLDAAGRARIAAALLAACGKTAPPPELERLASPESLREAVGWGLAIRLASRLSGGAEATLRASTLERDGDALVLTIERSRAHLVSDKVANDLKNLAQWLALEPAVRIASSATGKPARRASLTQV
jgi:exopolyphosphatase/guanosine-5'-triphosphate,3'-diphosphate pyrophosphatase